LAVVDGAMIELDDDTDSDRLCRDGATPKSLFALGRLNAD
jgi:hypothetical protein